MNTGTLECPCIKIRKLSFYTEYDELYGGIMGADSFSVSSVHARLSLLYCTCGPGVKIWPERLGCRLSEWSEILFGQGVLGLLTLLALIIFTNTTTPTPHVQSILLPDPDQLDILPTAFNYHIRYLSSLPWLSDKLCWKHYHNWQVIMAQQSHIVQYTICCLCNPFPYTMACPRL